MIKRKISQYLILFSFFFLCFALTLKSQDLEQDSLALVALYNSTDGPNWINNDNWLTGPLYTWHGLNFLSNKLIEIHLNDNNLNGVIPEEIGNLQNIEYLVLARNNLSGSIPSSIGNLTTLVDLSLNSNNLNGAVPDELVNLINLKTFNVFDNKLSEMIDMSSLPNLNFLELTRNKFTFEDIEPNIGISIFNYDQQDSVGQRIDTTLSVSSSFTINMEVGGTANSYQWKYYSTNIEGATSSTLHIDHLEESDEGKYICEITNFIAPELKLYSYPINVKLSSQTAANDSIALVALYESTNGANWTNNENWLSGPISTWYGIVLQDKHVITVNLRDNNLVGSIPHQIQGLSSLKYLILEANQLSGVMPKEIGNLPNLIRLNLHYNNLSGNIPQEIGFLTNLEELVLSVNNFRDTIPNKIYELSNLRILALQSNQFSGNISPEIGNLGDLEYLSLNVNQFSGPIPNEIIQLSKLKEIAINSNDFNELPNLSSMTQLNSLIIDENRFTFEDIERNLNINGIYYGPQKMPFERCDTNIQLGSDFILDAAIGGSANSYKWFFAGREVPGVTESFFIIDSATAYDKGLYVCEVTSSIVPNLTIIGCEKYVNVGNIVEVNQTPNNYPNEYSLSQNYPNPFNPSTTINYSIPLKGKSDASASSATMTESRNVTLIIYDMLGREVAVMVNEKQNPGYYEVVWNASEYPSGVYIYSLTVGSFKQSKKLIMLK